MDRSLFSAYNRSLLRELVATDFKLRYQGSVLGYLWTLMKPLALFAVLYVVFSQFLRLGRDIENYPIYLLLGVIMWSFFVEASVAGMESMINRESVLRKVNIPKIIILLSTTMSSLVNLLINLVVVVGFALANGVSFRPEALLVVLVLIELFIFALAVGALLTSWYIKFRDMSHIWEVLLQAAFYATPIVYPLSATLIESETIRKLLVLNPMAQMIQDARYLLITKEAVTPLSIHSGYYWAIPYIVVVAIIVWAYFVFSKRSKYFAEYI